MFEIIGPIAAVSFGLLFLTMSVLWWINTKINNAAIVDVGWGNGFALVTVIACLMADGYAVRQWLIGGMVVFWGVRLATHLFIDRVWGDKPEDGRYQDIRARWKTGINLKFFFFFQAQAVLIVLLSLPFMLSASNPDPQIAVLEWVGVGIWAIGLTGEALADYQLRRFKNEGANKGTTCRTGLWNYSRHPNYFFEWVIWVGYYVFALASPFGWLSIISPIGMLYILLRVTGIPLTEAQAVRTRGENYRNYQQTTSMFIPWFRKQLKQNTPGVSKSP